MADDARVLVTGGAGFLGSHLVAELTRVGRLVRVFDLPSARLDHLPTEGVELLQGDVRSFADVLAAVAGCEGVYHLAAKPTLWLPQRATFHAVNFIGTRNVLSAARREGVRYVIHTSTACILAQHHEPVSDDSPLPGVWGGPTSTAVLGDYAKSKLRAERLAIEFAHRGCPVLVASPTTPVGPGDRGLSPPTRLLLDVLTGRMPAYLDCRLNVVDVRDLAVALARLPDFGMPGRRYVLGGHNVTLAELLRQLSRLTGVPLPRWQIPYPVALAVGLVSEWIANVLTHQPPQATVAGVALSRRNLHVAPGHDLSRFGVPPRPFEQSLRDAVEWLRTATAPIAVRKVMHRARDLLTQN